MISFIFHYGILFGLVSLLDPKILTAIQLILNNSIFSHIDPKILTQIQMELDNSLSQYSFQVQLDQFLPRALVAFVLYLLLCTDIIPGILRAIFACLCCGCNNDDSDDSEYEYISKANRNNRSNQMNPNNERYWKARGQKRT